MLVFILSIIAGFAAPMVDPLVKSITARWGDDIKVDSGEYRTLGFAGLLLAVALLAWITGASIPAFWILLGGVLGLFGKRLFALGRKAWADRANRDDDDDDDDD